MPDQKVADNFIKLKNDVQNLVKLRTEAESSVKFAKQQHDAVVAKIREMGIDPDKAEQELEALQAELKVIEGQLEIAIATETKEYQKILAQTGATK